VTGDKEGAMTDEELWRAFHDADFTDIWYAHPGPLNYRVEKYGPRWFAGIWTGPQRNLICVRECKTNEEAEECLSPAGWTPDEAVKLALEKWAAVHRHSVAPLSDSKLKV